MIWYITSALADKKESVSVNFDDFSIYVIIDQINWQ